MKNFRFLITIKYILVTAAILNLAFLFGLHYEIPSSLKEKFQGGSSKYEDLYSDPNSESEQTTQAAINISFDTDTLKYDGSTSLDLLSGVSVTDKNGNPLELDIYSSIKRTEDSNVKTITYSVRDEEGNEAVAERSLVLSNYYGPALTIDQPYPEILDVELDHILEKFQSDNLLNANDGYGKNITNAIQCTYKIADEKAKKVDITYTITNHFEDTISKTITVPISRTKPLIVLSDTSVTLKKGEMPDPLSYIESATNEEGEDLKSLIEIEGNVNTAVAGNYTITYTLTDSDREQADPVALKITVEE